MTILSFSVDNGTFNSEVLSNFGRSKCTAVYHFLSFDISSLAKVYSNAKV